MKIAMISMQTSPLPDADTPSMSPPRIAELATELGRCGHEVIVYARGERAEEPDPIPGARVEYLPAGPRRPLSDTELPHYVADFGDRLAERWSTEKPDVAHAHGWTSGLAALSARSGDLAVPVVQTYLKTASPVAEVRQAKLERALGRAVGAVIAGCSQERDALVELGLPRPRISVIPAGVDTELFSDHGPAYPRSGRPRLLMLCGPGEGTGAAEAVRMLVTMPGVELVIAGGPEKADLETDKGVRAIRHLARDLDVEDRIIVLGRVARSNVPQLIRSADLVMSLGSCDPYGQVALEAMSCGVPVVASSTGGHLDMVVDNVTGILVRPDRPVEVARRVRALLGDPTRLTALGIAASDRARSRHRWDRIAAETVAIYERA
jgi:glycosyltransferase involved in cell wall biosynthesis